MLRIAALLVVQTALTAMVLHAFPPGSSAANRSGGTGAIPNGIVTLSCPADADLWLHADRAPRVLTAASGTRWLAEAEIVTHGGANTVTGLVMFRDQDNWLAWGVLDDGTLDLGGVLRGGPRPSLVCVKWSASRLRMVRAGSTYEFLALVDGEWRRAGQFEDVAGDLGSEPRVGLFAKSWRGSVAFEAAFRGWDCRTLPNPPAER